jgi:hypothetical protein
MTNFHLGRTVMIFGMVLPAFLAGQAKDSEVSGAPTVPEACAKEASRATGQPYMLATKRNLQFGFSSRPSPATKVPLAIWVSNPTNEEAAVMTCGDLEFFFSSGFDVLDHDGMRVPSKQEVNTRRGPSSDGRLVCLRNVLLRVPPHSCIHGDFDKPTYDLVKDLSETYALKPGRYTLTSRPRTGEQKQSTEGLTVQVVP